MTPGRDVKDNMMMKLQKDCDPGQRRKVQYGNVPVEGFRPRADT